MWCGRNSAGAPPEHIVPEALGCPTDAVLANAEVCERCNRVFSRLDRALADSFDFLRLAVGHPGKGGRPPAIASRRNVRTSDGREGYQLHINFGKADYRMPNGQILKPAGRSAADVQAELKIEGNAVTVKLHARMFHAPELSRALYKVALEGYAALAGREAFRSDRLASARAYARHGEGPVRRVLFTVTDPWTYEHVLWGSKYERVDGRSDGALVLPLRLCGFDFAIDCTPDGAATREALAKVRDVPGFWWSTVPPLAELAT
jgi:hypothetical protein